MVRAYTYIIRRNNSLGVSSKAIKIEKLLQSPEMGSRLQTVVKSH